MSPAAVISSIEGLTPEQTPEVAAYALSCLNDEQVYGLIREWAESHDGIEELSAVVEDWGNVEERT